MATIKQCKMLAARSKAAGMEYDFEAFKALDNGQVDEKLAEIEAFASKGKQEQTVAIAFVPERINNVRFGLACKLVMQQNGILWCISEENAFIGRVKQVYELLNKAEEALSASSSHSITKVIDDEGSTLEVVGLDEDYFKDKREFLAETAEQRFREAQTEREADMGR